jgi:DNA gyrase subunit A
MPETIHPASIVTETRERYLKYALSVITARALPDVRDGLKPVQRRILFTMYHDLRLHADGRPNKSAKITGNVTANYHPHGTVPAYEALVRLAQDWVMRMPLVDGQGNFGSVDGDSPAAERYTEAKLMPLADHLMSELKQRTVDMRPTYDGEREEPTVLPARFPNLLVNGSAGIAVGLATNIPPHNLGEVIRAAIHLIDEPEASTAQLLDRVKGPDFPLGGKVLADRATLRRIYEEGTGGIKVQGEWKEEESGKKRQLVITSIPYGVDRGNLKEQIGAVIAERRLPQALDLWDESNAKEGMRIVIEIRRDADPNLVMAYLYKHTALQESFSYNLTCLVPVKDGGDKEVLQPQRFGLKALLRRFVDFRFATVRRRFEFELEQLRRRIHILEGFRIIFDALDKAIKLIRESSGKPDAAEKLIKAFKLDTVQADAVLDAQLYRIAQMEIQKILDELREKTAEAERIEALLRSNKKLWGVVKEELAEVGDKFGDRRRTRIGSADDAPDFDPEAYIVRENTNVVLTRDGWIKRVGRLSAVENTRVREGDAVLAVAPGSTLDHVIFLADDGTAYTMRMNEVPASSGYGEPVAKFFRLADEVRLIAAVSTDPRFTTPDEKPKNGDPPGPHLLVATAQGQTLRTPLAPFRTASTRVGRRYVKLAEDDKVVLAQVVGPAHRSLFLASADGHVIHFQVEEVNILAGVGKGVIGIKLEKDDTCLGGALIRNQHDALVVETSGGKTMEFHGSREVTGRGGKGFEAVKRSSFVRVLPPPIELVDWEQVEGKKENGKANGDEPRLFD